MIVVGQTKTLTQGTQSVKYEVRYGKLIQLITASNEYQACIRVLQKHKDEDNNYSHFEVVELKPNGKRMAIPLVAVVRLLIQNQEMDNVTLGD
jgi:hypothetical protein